MKLRFAQILGICTTVLFLASCEKDEDRLTVRTENTPVLTASATTATLLQNNADQTAVTYTWTPLTFNWSNASDAYNVPVTYTLQFDKKGNNFAAPREISTSATTSVVTVRALNTIYTDLKLPAGTPTTLDVRLRTVYSGNQPTVYTPVAPLTATPYESQELPADTWAIIGDAAQGWSTDVPMTYDFTTRTFVLTTDLKATGGFKFRPNNDWPGNYGEDSSGSSRLKLDGGNISSPGAGRYTIRLNLNSSPAPTFTIQKI